MPPSLTFRMLAMEYLGREDLVHVKPKKENTESILPKIEDKPFLSKNGTKKPIKDLELNTLFNGEKVLADGPISDFLTSVDGDAPNCNLCGHVTVRSGTCYKCLNCGNSLGCS